MFAQIAIITFITFDYSNGSYDSCVELNLVQNSKLCSDGYTEAAKWLETQGFAMTDNPDVWTRGKEKPYNTEPYTITRALITGLAESPDTENRSWLCHEGHIE